MIVALAQNEFGLDDRLARGDGPSTTGPAKQEQFVSAEKFKIKASPIWRMSSRFPMVKLSARTASSSTRRRSGNSNTERHDQILARDHPICLFGWSNGVFSNSGHLRRQRTRVAGSRTSLKIQAPTSLQKTCVAKTWWELLRKPRTDAG